MTYFFLLAAMFTFSTTDLNLPQSQHNAVHVSSENSITSIWLFQPESMDAGDKDALKPFEGFSIISVAGILLTVALVVFVVFKVMRGMNRKEESATEE